MFKNHVYDQLSIIKDSIYTSFKNCILDKFVVIKESSSNIPPCKIVFQINYNHLSWQLKCPMFKNITNKLRYRVVQMYFVPKSRVWLSATKVSSSSVHLDKDYRIWDSLISFWFCFPSFFYSFPTNTIFNFISYKSR